MAGLLHPRILVAEDVRAISMRISHVLQGRGYEVEIARDGEECLERIGVQRPDLLILDLMMPRLNGIEVLKRLREDPATRDLAVIVCTAKDFSADMEQVHELGVVGVIIKPFDQHALAETVDRFFNREIAKAPLSPLPAAPTEIFAPKVDVNRSRIILWGTRGSIPVSGARFLRHGGNTSCMEYACGNDHLIFDAGSGIKDAGDALAAHGPRHLHLFITHTHWDHIQGFPFFTPIYLPNFEITIYGERGFGKNHESLLSGQLDRDYFPIQRSKLAAKVNFRFLDDDPVVLGDIKVTHEFTHHPGATVAFKIEHHGRTIVYAPDNEFLHGYLGSPQGISRNSEIVIPQEPVVEFISGADLLLHEAQYLSEEYSRKIGWGHSNLANACVLAKLAGVKKWTVIHHDPAHDDTYLDNKLTLTSQILQDIGCPTQVVHGHDGMVEYL
jgi:CheY-like chemotaxis protein